MDSKEYLNSLTSQAIGCAMKVHSALGPGLLESAYETVMVYELKKLGLDIQQQVALPLIYEEIKLDHGYRADILIENKVILEIKAVETFNDLFLAQLLTYLKFSGNSLGLVLNFNVKSMKAGINRVVHNF